MAYVDRITRNLGSTGLWPWEASIEKPELYEDPRALYWRLEAYYLQNSLYEGIQEAYYYSDTWIEAMKNLRGVSHRVVEFYVSKLWPGVLPDALPIVADNSNIIDPIQQVWKWSNWASKKQVFSRWLSLFGNQFLKVVSSIEKKKVWFQNIRPEYVVDFELDEMGFLEWIRIDIPKVRRLDGQTQKYIWTEVWEEEPSRYRVWEHTKPFGTPLDQLGNPVQEKSLSAFGVDFIPIVHTKFQDIGDDLGVGSFTHALDKIDEANRMATRLHQLLYRYEDPVWAVSANSQDPSGRPIPAPRLSGTDGGTENTIQVGSSKVVYLPGMSKLELMIPQINYEQALKIIQDHMDELEKDLPELAYYKLREMGEGMSGVAIRNLLSDTVDKVLEVRGNAETGLARADAMALTIGEAIGLEGFKGLGKYEDGDLDHTFGPREVIPMTELERMTIIKEGVAGGLGLKTVLGRVGWSEQEIKNAMTEVQELKDAENRQYTEGVMRNLRANQASREALELGEA